MIVLNPSLIGFILIASLDLSLFKGEASAKDVAVPTNCESNEEQPAVDGVNGGSRANLLSSITGFNKSNLRKAQSVDSSR